MRVHSEYGSVHPTVRGRINASTSYLVDRIEFTAPLGFAGSVAERTLLRPYLRYLITVRNRFLTAEPLARRPRPRAERPRTACADRRTGARGTAGIP